MREVNTYISLRWEPVTKRTALKPKISWEDECSKKEVVRVTAGFNCLWLVLVLAVRELLVVLPRYWVIRRNWKEKSKRNFVWRVIMNT
jgi:hypothetical protein